MDFFEVGEGCGDLVGHTLDTIISNKLSSHPICSVPDAESQRQHDSWPAQRRLFEFPSVYPDSQYPEYCAYDFGEHMIISFLKDQSGYPRQQVAIVSLKGILLKLSGQVIFANR